MKPRPAGGGLVYSTDSGRTCPGCRQPIASCDCRDATPPSVGDGIVRVSRVTHGRRGKSVTLVRGLLLDAAALNQIARDLKNACGSGGAVKDGTIELQGEQVDRVITYLRNTGWPVKRAGG